MNKVEISNDSSEIKRRPVSVIVSDRERHIHHITYGLGIIYHDAKIYGRYPGARDEILRDNNIVDMGRLMLMANPQLFYQMYTCIEDDNDRKALRQSLEIIYEQIKEYAQENVESNVNYQELRLPYSITTPVFTTMSSHHFQRSYSFGLNDSHNLDIVKNQHRNAGIYGTVSEYKNGITEPYEIPGCYINPLTKEIVHMHSKYIFQSDIEEYRKLLDNLALDDEYYSDVLAGSAEYVSDIAKLIRKCKK